MLGVAVDSTWSECRNPNRHQLNIFDAIAARSAQCGVRIRLDERKRDIPMYAQLLQADEPGRPRSRRFAPDVNTLRALKTAPLTRVVVTSF